MPQLYVRLTSSTPKMNHPYTHTPPRKAPPITALAMATSPTSIMTSPMSLPPPEPTLSNFLEQPLEPTLLTCPHCSYIMMSTASSVACTWCVRRFKQHERRDWNDRATLTSFPSLLEEHAIIREREEEKRKGDDGGGGVYGSWGRMYNALWGGGAASTGTLGRRNSVESKGSEMERSVGEGVAEMGTSIGVFGFGSILSK